MKLCFIFYYIFVKDFVHKKWSLYVTLQLLNQCVFIILKKLYELESQHY
ncbi:hypothetical protein KL86DYS2_10903 [uncultured Dysgonomonas sp.]|uniref:Uncharacterized protein n=1 Tax=uncultured Dysgonomonas sp. TaxID=206096 RepID=A0A212J7K1_9BACT|nr:hypothetical protein KL86DYS2_10903 [uncultured Dysgonomonas sp.]